jgi:hypothetical protein
MSGFTDTTMGVRAIGTRTDSAGDPVTDISAEEDRFANIFVSEGYISPVNAFAPAADTSWNIDIGSGTTKADYYVVEGQGVSQGNYVVRLDQAGDVVTIDPADLSNPRLDAIYLVVMDNAYDASGMALPRLAVREGDPGAVPDLPGPDPAWLAYAILGTVSVPAAAADITECTVIDMRIQSQSNVDAPTLEGNAAAAFAQSDHDHDATYAPLSHATSGSGHPDAGAVDDGMMSAASKSKLNAIETGAEDNLSAAEILALLLTVDGSGSGIDADLLDGSSSAAFIAASHDHDGTYYTKSATDTLIVDKAWKVQQVDVDRPLDSLTASGFEGSPLFQDQNRLDWPGHVILDGFISDHQFGLYLVEAQVVFAANSAGTVRQIRLSHNEDGNVAFGREAPMTGGEATYVSAQTVVYMDGTDRITMYIFQDSGSNVAISGVTEWLKLTYLG